MRRILPLLLLFAVCWHTAWSGPSHLASHLPEQATHSDAGLLCEQPNRETPTSPGQQHPEEDAAHAACGGCAAHAQQALGLRPHLACADPAQVHVLHHPQPTAVADVHQARHWPFASRDPPAGDTL